MVVSLCGARLFFVANFGSISFKRPWPLLTSSSCSRRVKAEFSPSCTRSIFVPALGFLGFVGLRARMC
jgi:hypothetical protein